MRAIMCIAILGMGSATIVAFDQYGGWEEVKGRATGFFHAEEIGGRWWLVTPEGNAFLSKGVCAVRYEGDRIGGKGRSPYNEACQQKYGSREAWSEAAVKRLKDCGFNTLGAWSGGYLFDRGLAYTVILNVAARAGANWQHGTFVDVFGPRFAQSAEDQARKQCAPRKDDPWLLGYFTDNELHWGPDWRTKTTLLEEYLMLPAGAPGREKAVGFLKERYGGDAAKAGEAWGGETTSWEEMARAEMKFDGSKRTAQSLADSNAFLAIVAEQYFKVCREAVQRHDPNHMVMGARFAGHARPEVLAPCGKYSDAVSLNMYLVHPHARALEALYRQTQRPIIIGEFSFRGMDSGLPNTKGAGPKVKDQEARAAAFERYVTELVRLPFVVGYHWFKYADEPKEGRFDGENSNYGLVDNDDNPWQVLCGKMTEVNAKVYGIAKH